MKRPRSAHTSKRRAEHSRTRDARVAEGIPGQARLPAEHAPGFPCRSARSDPLRRSRLRPQGAVRPRRSAAAHARRACPRSRSDRGDSEPGFVNTIDDAIRRAAGRHAARFQAPVAPTQLEGLDGGHHAPRQPEPVDMDKFIRSRGQGASADGHRPERNPAEPRLEPCLVIHEKLLPVPKRSGSRLGDAP